MCYFARKLFGLLLAASLGLLSACGDPCRELSEQICTCSASPESQRACKARIASRAAQRQSLADSRQEQAGRQVCADLLAGCTCAALAAGNWQACGLSVDAATP